MHDSANLTILNAIFTKSKKQTCLGIISKPPPFTKVKLKRPLSRGSRFKIHFGLEF